MADCNHLQTLIEAAKLLTYDIVVVQEVPPQLLPALKNPLLRKLIKILELTISHAKAGNQIREHRYRDAIIVHGFSTEFLVFTFIFSRFQAKNVYFLTHHNVQQAFQSSFIGLLFQMYHSLGYRFILNETTSILKELGYSENQISQDVKLLHPIVKMNPPNLLNDDTRKKIGLVGKIRKGKQFDKTFNLLLEIQKSLDFVLVIGTDDFSYFNEIDTTEIKLVDTSTRDNYFAALALCDIIVLNYEKSKYFYRCSGVAADAISVGTCVVCPDFPLMRNQINYPTKVGVLYDSELELEQAIRKAMEMVSNPIDASFKEHYMERSIEKVAASFAEVIQSQIELRKS